MATTTTRVKDIPTTATTAASDDYFVIDGATNGTRKYAHNSDAAAHGFGVYTVAQLNAFTSTNRPTGCVYCSDCIVPEGVGSPVVWSGTFWICTTSGIVATTDILSYFRSIKNMGRDVFSPFGVSFRQNPYPYGNPISSSGAGVTATVDFDSDCMTWSTGSTSTGSVSDAALVSRANFGPSLTQRRIAYGYVAEGIFIPTPSSSTDEFSYRRGFTQGGPALAIHEACLMLDRGNALNAGNSGNSANWLCLTRKDSVNTLTVTDIPATTKLAERQQIEVLLSSGSCSFFINGVLVSTHTTNVPADTENNYYLQMRGCLLKSTGTNGRMVATTNRFAALRYAV